MVAVKSPALAPGALLLKPPTSESTIGAFSTLLTVIGPSLVHRTGGVAGRFVKLTAWKSRASSSPPLGRKKITSLGELPRMAPKYWPPASMFRMLWPVPPCSSV